MKNGEAFGHPGLTPNWTSSAKQGIGTSLSVASPVWFTLGHGILNEIYFPSVDTANTRDAQYIVADETSFMHEEKRHMKHGVEYSDPRSLAFRQTNTDSQGRYRIIKETISDPNAPVVLVHTRFEALKPEANNYRIYTLIAPHIGNQGMGNSARSITVDGRDCLVAERAGKALAVIASIPFLKRSCGFVGVSDGWTDLHTDFRMDWEFASATDGNVALMGELDTRHEHEWVLAIGFGASGEEAAHAAIKSLRRGWEHAHKRYLRDWHAYCDSLTDLSTVSADNGRTYYTSAMLIRAHEDRLHPGAICASLSIPWGEIHGDQDVGGYHLVWPRDLVQAATAALAAGDVDLAVRVLRYLASIQSDDGGMPQNCWVDGRPHWRGIQLDEVAFPIMLAWHLHHKGLLGGFDPWHMVKAGAAYIIKKGPSSPQERWEEDAGISPSSLSTLIAALVCTADIATKRGDGQISKLCLDTADYWATNIERWTYTKCGSLLKDNPEHYVRISSIDKESGIRDPDKGYVLIKNLPDGAKRYPAREIIGGGFLGLVRYGMRSACDEHILKTLVVYDIVLKIDTPYGPGWHRYNHDGYGQKANGDPFDSTGVGRLWPLLTGERGHYEIAAGRPAYEYIRTMEGFASSCSLIPEQVWDTTDIPDEHMLIGRPTGSALPLVWAHAEYIKLLRSEHDAAIFDLITAVRKRYIDDCVTTDLQVWTFKQRLGEIHPGQPLRIEVYAPARLHWTANDWITAQDTELCDAGLGVYAHEFNRGQFDQAIALRFTLYWHSTKKWEGSDFSVRVDKKASGLQDGRRRKEFEPRID
ncbi:MAG: glycoside hydrolase family 15 protein [Nitrosospira sp.]